MSPVRVPGPARAARILVEGQLRDRLAPGRRASRDRHRAFYRDLWQAAARRVGAGCRPGTGDALEIEAGDTRLRVEGTRCSLDDTAALRRAGDKVLVHRLLAEQGVPVPAHRRFTLRAADGAGEFLATAHGPCVVKPARDSSGGHGVTTGVRTRADLRTAAVEAAAAGARSGAPGSRLPGPLGKLVALPDVPLLVEEQLPGENYRLLYVDGRLVDAVRRGVPSVVGDGRSTVGELLVALNASRRGQDTPEARRPVPHDQDVERTLAAQGLTIRSVPARGVEVRLQTKINDGLPAANHPARDELHPDIVAAGARAAMAVGVRWAGVDVITPDPGQALEDTGGAVLEVNTTPGLAMHLHSRRGAVNPAEALLAYLTTGHVPVLGGVR